jgi:hypothetical protein
MKETQTYLRKGKKTKMLEPTLDTPASLPTRCTMEPEAVAATMLAMKKKTSIEEKTLYNAPSCHAQHC